MGSPYILVKDGTKQSTIITGDEAIANLLVRACAAKLISEYPQYIWKVWISSDHSVVNIICPMVDMQYGYVLHTKEVQEDPDLKCITRAGGEILERGRLAREAGISVEEYAKTIDLGGAERVRLADKGVIEKKVIS